MADESKIDWLILADSRLLVEVLMNCDSALRSHHIFGHNATDYDPNIAIAEGAFGRQIENIILSRRPEAIIYIGLARGLPPTMSGDVVVVNEFVTMETSNWGVTRRVAEVQASRFLLQAARRCAGDSFWRNLYLQQRRHTAEMPKIYFGSASPTSSISADLANQPRATLAIEENGLEAMSAAQKAKISGLAVLAVQADDRIRRAYGETWSKENAACAAAAVAMTIVAQLRDLSQLSQVESQVVRVPPQSPAPIRVELRAGRVAPIQDIGPLERTEDAEFDEWRLAVSGHISELCGNDFDRGTNHPRIRRSLLALNDCLSLGMAAIRTQEFRLGYEIERFESLLGAYNSHVEEVPAVSVEVLADLNLLLRKCREGINHLGRWTAFIRTAERDRFEEGTADPAIVARQVDAMAEATEQQPKYFDPELPRSLRFLSEAIKNPRGATTTMVYGAVKSIENVLAFLAERALATSRNAIESIETNITKAVAAGLVVSLGGIGLTVSGALPQAWSWLRPVLEAIAKIAN